MSTTLISAAALTSLARVKRYLRITGTGDDDLLTEMINTVSDRIARIAGRKFTAQDYREFYRPNSDRVLSLHHRPVLDLYRVGWGVGDALEVQYTGTDKIASVWVNNDGVNLRSMSADGTIIKSEDTFGNSPTFSAMATALNARAGWTVTNKVTADGESADLHRLNITNAKSSAALLTWPEEILDDYIVDLESGQVEYHHTFGNIWPDSSQRFGRSFQTMMVHYRAGYATVPESLQNLTDIWAARMFHLGRKDPNLRSESLGDYSYTLSDQLNMDDEVRDALRPWVDVPVSAA